MSDEKLVTKLDKFIVIALNNYCHVENPWDELKKVTGDDYDDIISKKSVCPDLVIYNKEFNKNECFYPVIKKNNPFPRVKFYIRKKKLKNNSLQNFKDINEKENKKNDDNYIKNDFIVNKKIYNDKIFQNFIINRYVNKYIENGFNNSEDNKEVVDFDTIINNNKERRNWEIKDKDKNGVINYFNSEQLYYFLNEKLNDKDFNYDFYIRDSVSDQYFYNIPFVYDSLKRNLKI